MQPFNLFVAVQLGDLLLSNLDTTRQTAIALHVSKGQTALDTKQNKTAAHECKLLIRE